MLGKLASLFGRNPGDRFISPADHESNVAKQRQMTPATLAQLRSHNVGTEAELALEFFFVTDTDDKATSLEQALLARGYSCEHGLSASDDGTFIVTGWTTRMRMADAVVVRWAEEMCELGFEHDADFDGWGTNPEQASDSTEAAEGAADEDKWAILEGTHEGAPLLVRFREFGPDFDRASYPTRLNIFWTMSDAESHQLGSKAEIGAMTTFEDRLCGAVEHDEHSLLSVVLTCQGQREFVFHTPDPQEFLARLTDMPQELAPYPIEIHSNEDPSWEYDASVTSTG